MSAHFIQQFKAVEYNNPEEPQYDHEIVLVKDYSSETIHARSKDRVIFQRKKFDKTKGFEIRFTGPGAPTNPLFSSVSTKNWEVPEVDQTREWKYSIHPSKTEPNIKPLDPVIIIDPEMSASTLLSASTLFRFGAGLVFGIILAYFLL